MRSRSIREVLHEADTDARRGSSFSARAWPTGFRPLDDYLGGGLRSGELTLVGGPQGQGKTTFALQIARNVAAAGDRVVYISYEHPDTDVFTRLVGMEAGLAVEYDAMTLDQLRTALNVEQASTGGLSERLGWYGGGAEAIAAVESYGDRLEVVSADGGAIDVDGLRAAVGGGAPALLIIDYLQKVAADGATETDRVTVVVEALKDLALSLELPVLAIVAADNAGISGGRVRLHHLRGSSALAYEADVALMLNDKYASVARHHLAYSTTNVEVFQQYVVCSIEKNRGGKDSIDMEFRKRFEHGFFETDGRLVVEQLIDDRLVTPGSP